MSDWHVFRGTPLSPHPEGERLQTLAPPWRRFGTSSDHRANTYLASGSEIRIVNAAIYLKRPILVTGPPGVGKSSLAYATAMELGLGDVLKWPINSRSSLHDGLYHYDAIARLRDANLQGLAAAQGERKPDDISGYLQLQWLGTAIASPTPRVVLIDEIDKADIDLPNDLLHVLEDGSFTIPELQRLACEKEIIAIPTCEVEGKERVEVKRGIVHCKSFPLIFLTSNGERELPLALHRRCLRLDIKPPEPERLLNIIEMHLKETLKLDAAARDRIRGLIAEFKSRRDAGRVMATDQLMNLVHLVFTGGIQDGSPEATELHEMLLRGLDE